MSMKTVGGKVALLGTTALFTLGALATAEAAERIKVGITGYFQAYGVYVDQDDGVGEPGANLREHTLQREGEIIFNGKTTLDNGVEVGVQVQLEAETCGDQIDESYIWFEGGFGRVVVGAENSAAYLMHYSAPISAPGWGLSSPNFAVVGGGGNQTNLFGAAVGMGSTAPVFLSTDSEKLTYFSPRIAGFQFGVSYTPDNCEEGSVAASGVACGGTYSGPEPDNNNTGEIFELSLNYVGKIQDVGLNLSASWGTADDEVGGAATDDPVEYSFGAQVIYAGFTLGAAYRFFENFQSPAAAPAVPSGFGVARRGRDSEDWNVGLMYATGPWKVGVTYAGREVTDVTLVGEDEWQAVEISGTYALGPGIDLAAGIQFHEIEDNAGLAANENDGTVLFVGTSVSY
jgi:outer membrane protein OmpU